MNEPTNTTNTTNTTSTESGICACGHVLDRSTDDLCRHCKRSDAERRARLTKRAAADLAAIAEAARFEADFLAALDRRLASRPLTATIARGAALASLRDARDTAAARALEVKA